MGVISLKWIDIHLCAGDWTLASTADKYAMFDHNDAGSMQLATTVHGSTAFQQAVQQLHDQPASMLCDALRLAVAVGDDLVTQVLFSVGSGFW